MKLQTNTSVDDREQWRERIMRALKELRGQESLLEGEMRNDDRRDDTSPAPAE